MLRTRYYNNTARVGRGSTAPSGLIMWDGVDSGWDNSPRWDKGLVEAVDLNGWLHLDQLFLAQMAVELGKDGIEVEAWRTKAKHGAAMFQSRLWDASSKVFWDRLPANATNKGGEFVKTVTPATFWSLLAGIASVEQASLMAAAVLTPSALGTPFPLSVVGRSDPAFSPVDYWRGPVWVNINWLSLLGLEAYGMHTQAAKLRQATVDVIAMNPTPREHYNPLNGSGQGATNYMWTGAVNIVIVNELAGRSLSADVLHDVIKPNNNRYGSRLPHKSDDEPTTAFVTRPGVASGPAANRGAFFMRGAAMGWLPHYDCNGTCSKYRVNATAAPQDALQILSDQGLNTVRLRLFGPDVCPENSYAGLDSVLSMARRARSAGLAVTLDVFYTQWVWACGEQPPGASAKDYQRRTPPEWKGLSFEELLQAVANYTHTAVSSLVEQGTPPQSVQIGNEINCGLLYSWPGQTCADGGEVCKCEDNWNNLAAIVKAAAGAVKSACPTAEVMIQYAASKDLGNSPSAGERTHGFYSALASAGAPFDSIGLSFYQVWGAFDVAQLCMLRKTAQALPDKKIYVIESAYPYKFGGRVPNASAAEKMHMQFPLTPAGQVSWLRALLFTVEHGLWGRGAGVSWWGAEIIDKCSHQCGALFDSSYVALPALTQRAFDSAKGSRPSGGVVCPPLES